MSFHAVRLKKKQGFLVSAYLPMGCDTARCQFPSKSVSFSRQLSKKPHVASWSTLTVRAALTMTACLSGGTELLTLVARPLTSALQGLNCRPSIFARAPRFCPENSPGCEQPGFFEARSKAFELQWPFSHTSWPNKQCARCHSCTIGLPNV
jgi:hypothetical protein